MELVSSWAKGKSRLENGTFFEQKGHSAISGDSHLFDLSGRKKVVHEGGVGNALYVSVVCLEEIEYIQHNYLENLKWEDSN